jgi:hypothetical protein
MRMLRSTVWRSLPNECEVRQRTKREGEQSQATSSTKGRGRWRRVPQLKHIGSGKLEIGQSLFICLGQMLSGCLLHGLGEEEQAKWPGVGILCCKVDYGHKARSLQGRTSISAAMAPRASPYWIKRLS